jgi:hypothetical protein
VASAYGWVTIVILSMVKRAHPLYSNKRLDSMSVYESYCSLRVRGHSHLVHMNLSLNIGERKFFGSSLMSIGVLCS